MQKFNTNIFCLVLCIDLINVKSDSELNEAVVLDSDSTFHKEFESQRDKVDVSHQHKQSLFEDIKSNNKKKNK